MRDEMLNGDDASQEYFSMADLADRWRCSRGTVYNRLRAEGAQVLDFAPRGKKGRKVVPASVIKHIEARNMRRLT
jgi:biotin operon repressor